MKGLLSDVNVQGHVDLLVAAMRGEPWKIFWDHLGIEYFHFDDVGLANDASDSHVWETCQARQLILITNNRNRQGSESLEATIQRRNSSDSLPVLTIADVSRLRASRAYAERVVESLLDALLRVESLLGAGRLFLP